MRPGGWKCLGAVSLALACAACTDYQFSDLCNPRSGGRRLGFYSTGDCVGLDAPAFLGHEWLERLANEDPPEGEPYIDSPSFDERDRFIWTREQLDLLTEGNRHTDYPLELLVHLDNGITAYLDALLAYQELPENQAPHSILRSDNWTLEAWRETLCVIRNRTREGVALFADDQVAALTKIGSATHTLQDSYAEAHTVRFDPRWAEEEKEAPACDYATTNWCICNLASYVSRSSPFDEPNTDPDAPDFGQPNAYHEREDYESTPGRAVAGDAVFRDELDCHEPSSANHAAWCLKPNAKQAVIGTRAYLYLVRDLATHAADGDEIDRRLGELFATHLRLCRPRTWDPSSCEELD